MGKIASTLFLGFVLTIFAAPSSLSALVGKALRLDGVDDFVETPDAPDLRNGAPIADEEMVVPPSAKSGSGADGKSPHQAPGRDWNPDSYRGWERRWDAGMANAWNIEPDGLMGRYNRVEGGYLAWNLPRTYHSGTGLANYGEVGYSLGQEEFSYRAGAEVFSFYKPANAEDNLVTVGGELHDLTDTQDGWVLTEEENSFNAALFRRDFRDYYRRTGWSIYTGHNFGGSLQVTGRYGWDEFSSLSNSVDGVAFDNRFTLDAFRRNPAIDDVQIRSLRADIQLDTRDKRHDPDQGWFANAMFERAGGVLSGDAEFKRYLGDLRRYQPVGRGTRVDMRLRLGTANGRLPSQFLYDLGGLSTLRGYGFKQFSGDRMVLLNAEYWIDGDAYWQHGAMPMEDMAMGVFFDMGSAWFADDAQNSFDRLDYLVNQPPRIEEDLDLKKSFGFGIKLGDSRLNIARALDGDGQGWAFSARFGRTL
jgi:outer membrane protein assembly factor BamA